MFAQTDSDFLMYGISSDGFLKNALPVKSTLAVKGIYLMVHYDHSIIKNYLSFSNGYGIETKGYCSNGILKNDSGAAVFNLYPDSVSAKKNKLSITSLCMPFELRFTSNQERYNHPFKVAVGFKLGYVLQSHTKILLKGSNQNLIKTQFTKNLNRLEYAPTLRIGIGPFQLLGTYSLNNLMKEKSKQNIQTYSVGLNFSISYKANELKNIFEELDAPKKQTTTFNF